MSAATCTNETFVHFTDLNDFEYSRIDNDDLLMSFLEEPEFEAGDEELLRSVIESLETENIAPPAGVNTNDDDSTLLEQLMKAEEDSTNLSYLELDCWIDSDMEYYCSTPSSSTDDMNIWSTDCYSGNGIEDLSSNFLGACKEFSWELPCESMLCE
ncbi:hypothetical protein HAX54_040995 [Datura stramonium]|uniref:Uncharacterized protein n=1 Tax=Datura stramonium TaxID=4076 RepID=A0ABS8VND0_DATST|nr:hypothetical protein [Datura stramonium]